MDRPIASHSHDDGCDRWAVATAQPVDRLTKWVDRYTWWSERTESFTTRRELAATTGVMIVNLGAPLEIVDASGGTLRLHAGQGFAGGIAQATSLSRAGGEMLGVHVHLSPATMARLLGAPLAALTDRCVPLTDLIGDTADRLGEALVASAGHEARWRMLDAFIAQRAAAALPVDMPIEQARAWLATGWWVERVATELGWSRKRLARRFHDAIGLHPRAFAGLARFERFATGLQAQPRRPLAHAALDAGYADQAHLTREVARYTDLSPAALRARLIPGGGGVRE